MALTHNEGATPCNATTHRNHRHLSHKKKRIEQQQQHVLKSNMATICQSAREQRENPHGNNNNNKTQRTLGKNCTWNFYSPWQRRARNLCGSKGGEGPGWASSGAQNLYLKRKKKLRPLFKTSVCAKVAYVGSVGATPAAAAATAGDCGSDSDSGRECHRSLSLSLTRSE